MAEMLRRLRAEENALARQPAGFLNWANSVDHFAVLLFATVAFEQLSTLPLDSEPLLSPPETTVPIAADSMPDVAASAPSDWLLVA